VYWVGLVLLGLGVVLLGCTNPWQFFEAAEGGFFDWTEVFWYLQWGGFWLVTASLLVFGGLAWQAPGTFVPRWRLVPASVALLIFVLFFVCSMPEKSNQRDWKNGWLGVRVYGRTKVWLKGDEGGENALPERLAGHWEAPGGFSFTISPHEIRMMSPGREIVWSADHCRHRFQTDYDFTFRSVLAGPIPAGLTFSPFDQTGIAAALPLPDRRFPRLYASCDGRVATWVLVDIDRLLAIMESGRVLVGRRS
jgi:hypothetical protein